MPNNIRPFDEELALARSAINKALPPGMHLHPDDFDDIMQETFLTLYAKRADPDADYGSSAIWSIARSRTTDFLRSRNRRHVQLADIPSLPIQHDVAHDIAEMLRDSSPPRFLKKTVEALLSGYPAGSDEFLRETGLQQERQRKYLGKVRKFFDRLVVERIDASMRRALQRHEQLSDPSLFDLATRRHSCDEVLVLLAHRAVTIARNEDDPERRIRLADYAINVGVTLQWHSISTPDPRLNSRHDVAVLEAVFLRGDPVGSRVNTFRAHRCLQFAEYIKDRPSITDARAMIGRYQGQFISDEPHLVGKDTDTTSFEERVRSMRLHANAYRSDSFQERRHEHFVRMGLIPGRCEPLDEHPYDILFEPQLDVN